MNVPLTNGLNAGVDDEDLSKVMEHSKIWTRAKNGYVYTWSKKLQKTVYLHRVVLDFPDKDIDHIDGRKVNNRKSNLRVTDSSTNAINRGPRFGKQWKGTFRAKAGKFSAQVRKNYTKYSCGTFNTEEEAARAYDKKALELYGTIAYLNFPIKNKEMC